MRNKKENNPLVSVIVTTYNRQELLKETINSILDQSYKNFELIVVDNFSDYDFPNYIKTFNDSRIKAFQNQNNGIIAVNRNYGIKKSYGSFIAFCDDDDLWFPEKLKIQVSYMLEKVCIGVGSNLIFIGDSKHQIHKRSSKDILIGFKYALMHKRVPLSSLVIKNIGCFFDESKDFIAVEDYDIQLKVLLKSNSQIILIGKPLIYYRLHDANQTFNKNITDNVFNVFERYKKYLLDEEQNYLLYRINKYLGVQNLKNNIKNAEGYLWQAYKFANSFIQRIRLLIIILIAKLPSCFSIVILDSYYRNK